MLYIAFAILLVIKITGLLHISWLIVFLPLLALLAMLLIPIIVGLVVLVALAIAAFMGA